MQNDIIDIPRYERRFTPTLRDLTAVVFRQRKVIIGAFIAVVLLVVFSGMWMRRYQAHMKILVLHQRTDAMVSGEANAPSQNSGDVTEEDLNSEVEILSSQDLLRKVVLETNLQHHVWFNWGNDDAKATAIAVRKLASNLDIEPIRKANVISVSYRSSNPQLAAKVLNALASGYMEKHLEVRRPSGEFKFFEQQAAEYRKGLENSQEKLADFTKKSGVVSADVERDLTLQRLADFDATAHQAQASEQETAKRIEGLKAQLQAMQPRQVTSIKTGENPYLMQQMKSTLFNLELKRAELLAKFDPSYRPVQEVEQQIALAKASIAAEESKPPKDVTTDEDPTYVMLRSELAKAEADLTGLRARAVATNTVANEYRMAARNLELKGIQQDDLLRETKTQEENYLLYTKKREEARISDALDQRGIMNVSLAERPVVPALPAQSPVKMGGITFLLAFFVSLGAGFVADFADPSFRTPDEVVGYLEMPVLASLPKSTDR
jgi:uncharacterized protein involved in exopolysaccharide biosynthesis